MTERMEHRYEVTFTASEALDGRPVITLILNQEGQAAAGQDSVFFLEVDQAIARDATSRVAAFLTQYIKGFGVMIRAPQVGQNPSEPDGKSETNVLRPDALEEDTASRDEPEPNPEKEGQPIPPLQNDGMKGTEAKEPYSQSEKAEGLIRTEDS